MRLAGNPLEHGRFVLDFDLAPYRKVKLTALACIVRTAEYGVTDEPVCCYAEIREAPPNRSFKIAFGVVEREFDFG